MTQKHERRASPSPYIDTVRRSTSTTDGIYLVTPDGSWDLITAMKADGTRTIFVTGQSSQPNRLPYRAGESSVVISFAAGAYLTPFRGASLTDSYVLLTVHDANHFELAGHILPIPTFENAEELIGQMVYAGLLVSDAIVESVMQGNPKSASKRSIERHFKTTTGISPKKMANIRRAQHAVRLLKKGTDPSTAAMDAGYYDQPHLTKELKQLMDSSPRNVDDVNQV